MTRPTRCLSVRQPWAWLILHAGKDVENRTWSHPFRGPVYIHASSAGTRRRSYANRVFRWVGGGGGRV